MSLEVLFIGISDAFPKAGEETACFLVNRQILVDTGWNVAVNVLSYDVSPTGLTDRCRSRAVHPLSHRPPAGTAGPVGGQSQARQRPFQRAAAEALRAARHGGCVRGGDRHAAGGPPASYDSRIRGALRDAGRDGQHR